MIDTTFKCDLPPAPSRINVYRRNDFMKNQSKKMSIRNQLAGKIIELTKGKVVSEVVVRTAAGDVASIITTGSVKQMKLKKGDKVSVMVKATEAFIQK
jgi:molybdopterin-binding protein